MTKPLEPKGLLQVAESVALLAGHHLRNKRNEWKGAETLGVHDIKLHADKFSEKLIVEHLQLSTPEIGILGEEFGLVDAKNPSEKNDSELTWIVDPLDGSLNYNRGIQFCCVSIALYNGWNPVLGVVYDFNRDELFSGLINSGAYLNQKKITVSTVSETSKGVLATGFPSKSDFSNDHLISFVGKVQSYCKVRLLGSAALSLCYVANGSVDMYNEENIMFWDIAAGCALVKAAGGSFEISNKRSMSEPINVVASNSLLQTPQT